MTFPSNDEPQAVEPAADLATEAGMERCTGYDLQADASTATSAEVESSLSDSPEHNPLSEEPALFANVFQPEPPPPPVRIPHLGHVALLAVYLLLSLFLSGAIVGVAVYFHLFNVTSFQSAMGEIHYALGYEVLLYLGAFAAAYFTFPLIWHKGFFAGLQWNGATAWRLKKALIGIGFICFVLAMVNIFFIPGPANAPIEKMFKQPGAAWLLFIFGVTCAPFFEELFFRGFLLPSLCTAYDWLAEKFYHVPRRPLDSDGNPQWSFSAMAIASLVTSAPFALMHAAQTGDSVDAVLLLVCVSLVLCAVRLVTRSLASSVLVHAFYNFLIFSLMLLGTEGFKHLDKM